MRRRAAVLFVFVVTISGCSWLQPQVRTVTVVQKVATPVWCTPPTVERPLLAIDALEAGDLYEVTRALWASLAQQDGYIGQLEAALDVCRAPQTQ